MFLSLAWLVGPTTSEAQTVVSAPAVSQRVQPLSVRPDPESLRVDPSTTRVEVPEGEPGRPLPPGVPHPILDPVLQARDSQGDAIGQISNPSPNVPGMTSGPPPDTVIDVGPNHVVQMVNSTTFQVWNKQGTSLGGPFSLGAMWPAGDPCNSSLGDPIVVYDHLADRWLLSQFARNAAQTRFWMCIAISQTPSPLPPSAYFLYTIEVPAFPDYPKFGVWPDAYYMSSYEQSNLGVFAFERQQMLNGTAAAFIKFTISSLNGAVRDTRILPADLDGPPPPDGTPGLFFRSVDDQQDSGDARDRLEFYEFDVDWLTLAATFTEVDDIDGASSPALAPFNTMACNRTGMAPTGPPDQTVRDCIPEPDSDDTLDALSNRPMSQLKFRVIGPGDFRMVVNQTIDVSGSIPAMLGITPANEVAGIRWYELQKTGTDWVIRQQGTYAAQPLNATTEGDLVHRWMGSAAIDRFGNIAIGYSVVNDSNDDGVLNSGNELYAGIRYTGRRFDDPLGLMQQGEKSILNGTGPQGNIDGAVNPSRWGDYSALTVDPRDDCTFWYSTHGVNGITRIAAFFFDNCGTDLRITKSGSPSPVFAGQQVTYTIAVTNDGPSSATNVRVVDVLPAGTTFLDSSIPCASTAPPPNEYTCTLGTLAPGETRSFTILVRVNADQLVLSGGPAIITNTATVAADQNDPNLSNNTATANTTVNEQADLRIAKECKPDQPNAAPAGTTTFCEIYVDNLGPSDARNVVVTDRIISSTPVQIVSVTVTSTVPPAGVCAPLSTGPVTDVTITCTDTVLPVGARNTIRVTFTAANAGDVNDTATVSSSTPDPDSSNNVAVGRVSFSAVADLSLTKTDSPDPVIAGTNLAYRVEVRNNGPSTAANVVIKDSLPALVSFQSATPSAGGTCQAGVVPGDPSKPLTCNFGTLLNGATATIDVVVKVNSDVASGTVLVNNAEVSSASADPDNSDNIATQTTTVDTNADLEVSKTSDSPNYKPSTLVTYQITVRNNGPSKALNVVVTDTLPDTRQAIYQSDTGGCVFSNPATLTCNLGDMAVGQVKTFFVYVVVRGSRGDVSNTAVVSSATADAVAANNTSTRIVSIKGKP